MFNSRKYRLALKARAAELRESLTRRQGIEIEAAADDMDRTIQAAARDLAILGLDEDHRKLRAVEAALMRIEQGTFGDCLRCEEPIAERRLNAVPWAALCLGCQEEADHLHYADRRAPVAA
jgi:DnaK suppressor protein